MSQLFTQNGGMATMEDLIRYLRQQPQFSPVNGSLVREDGLPVLAVAKVFIGTGNAGYFPGSTGTSIPTSVNPIGDYTTKLVFQGNVRDDLGTVIDMVNSQFVIPSGYKECRIIYNMAWAPDAVGWRGCRIKSGSANYGNVRAINVGSGATTNNNCVTPWTRIVASGGSAPDTISVGAKLDLWPAHTSTTTPLTCGADLASSFAQLELR